MLGWNGKQVAQHQHRHWLGPRVSFVSNTFFVCLHLVRHVLGLGNREGHKDLKDMARGTKISKIWRGAQRSQRYGVVLLERFKM